MTFAPSSSFAFAIILRAVLLTFSWVSLLLSLALSPHSLCFVSRKRKSTTSVTTTQPLHSLPADAPAEMHSSLKESFFHALFGFTELDYLATRHELFQKFTFETQTCSTPGGTQRVVKERVLFEHPRLGRGHLISSGWHSTPSVAELRDEVKEHVRTFENMHPGYLAALCETPPVLRGKTGTPNSNTAQTAATHASHDHAAPPTKAWVQCSHTVGESGDLHQRFPGAFFQVASQFNMLEFISSQVTPEAGVTHYVRDRTQGPACALACMVGTAYRNYLLHPCFITPDTVLPSAEVGELERGQQKANQANLLRDLTRYLMQERGVGNHFEVPQRSFSYFYSVHNGYFSPETHMNQFASRLKSISLSQGFTTEKMEDELLSRLRIGVTEDVTVTLPLHSQSTGDDTVSSVHEVSQSYNSALSMPSTRSDPSWPDMEMLARIVLRGTYEATLLAGVLHTLRSLKKQHLSSTVTKDGEPNLTSVTLPPIFLTKVGGGVFNNDAEWIAAAIEEAVNRVASLGVPLDIRLVHYGALQRYYVTRFPSWPVRGST